MTMGIHPQRKKVVYSNIMMFRSGSLLLHLLYLALYYCSMMMIMEVNSLVIPTSCPVFLSKDLARVRSCTFLLAKKRRRRRSDDDRDSSSSSDATSFPSSSSRSPPTNSDGIGDDSLPDFDLSDDDPDNTKTAVKSSMSSSSSSSGSPMVMQEGEISSAMMSSDAWAPTKSIRELLADRSLESKLKFDDVVTNDTDNEPLPDLMALQRQKRQQSQSSSFSSLQSTSVNDDDGGVSFNKKKNRQAQRQTAAAARSALEEEQERANSNPLTKIPFLLNEKGEVAGTKILEAGAWLGIFLLVTWELYINSPFFDRAAPITPVVY